MNEYVYKLNLPSIQKILLPGKYEELFSENTSNGAFSKENPLSYLKQEYTTLKQYKWDSSLLFYKSNGKEGYLHSDLPKCTWGINYINEGLGIMKYYDPNDIGDVKLTPDSIGNTRQNYNNPVGIKPLKIYVMHAGVYLANVGVPHMPAGYGKRYSLSIRSLDHQNDSWESVVENFKEYIV
jgi:hypothetical protein